MLANELIPKNNLRFQFITQWEDVMISEVGSEKGILKATTERFKLSYNFYPNSSIKNKITWGVKPRISFKQADIKDATCNDAVVKFKISDELGGKEYTLLFANENNALQFIGQVSISNLMG